MNKAVISTSSLNSYGTRVLTSGIDIEQYKRNPVLLYMHQRGGHEYAPIGKIENIHIEGDKLVGELVFDEKDEVGRKIAQKWQDGFLRMVSAGLTIIELSDDPKYLLPGQRRMTITKSKLDEVSVVDIGANDDALALYNAEGSRITLSQGDNIPELPLLEETPNTYKKEVMNEKIALALGLSKEASEDQALGAITQLRQKVDEAEKMRLALITDQVDEAIRLGKITTEQKETYMQIGLSLGGDHLRIALSGLSTPSRPSTFVHGTNPTLPGAQATYSKFTDIPPDQLDAFKQERPQEYVRLFKERYGFEPR